MEMLFITLAGFIAGCLLGFGYTILHYIYHGDKPKSESPRGKSMVEEIQYNPNREI